MMMMMSPTYDDMMFVLRLTTQIFRCRQLLQRDEKVLRFEHEIFRKLVSRGHGSMSDSFSYCVAFRSVYKDADKETSSMYARCIEFGTMIGIAEAAFDASTLFDMLMSHEDSQDLANLDRRQRGNDLKSVLDLWEQLKEHMCATCNSQSDFRAWFVLDTCEQTLASAINMESQNLLELADRVGSLASHDLPSFKSIRYVRVSEVERMSFSERVRAFNCFSNLNVTGKTGMGEYEGPTYISWQTSSVRNHLAAQLNSGLLCQSSVEQALLAQNMTANSSRAKSVRPRTSSRSASSSRSATSSCLRNFIVDEGDEHSNFLLHSFPSLQDRTLVSQVRSSLVKQGRFRILRNDDTMIQVVWNSYDPKSGTLVNLRFCTTTVEFYEQRDQEFTCLNCPSFQHSTQLGQSPISEIRGGVCDDALSGFCVHTQLLEVLVPHLKRSAQLPILPKDAFVLWALENVIDCGKDTVDKIFEAGGLMKFFVKVLDGAARNEGTSQVSICHISVRTDTSRMSCSASRCMEVTMKSQKKKIKQLDGLCCHLRALFRHDDFKHLWNMGSSGEGFNLNTQEDMETAIHRLSGEWRSCDKSLPFFFITPH